MKRLIPLLLLMVLLLGCSGPSENAPTTPPAPPSTPDPLQAFSLAGYDPLAVLPMGQDLLIVDYNKLTLLDGTDLSHITSVPVIGLPLPDSGHLWVRSDSVAYYHEGSSKLVFLNRNLHQTRTLALPADMVGNVCLSPDWTTLYYCTQTAIRALDIRSGTSRMLKEQGSAWQSITGLFLNGTALRCEAKHADGTVRISLISTENGTLLREDAMLSTLICPADRYFITSDVTCVPQLIFGTIGSDPQLLWPENEPDFWWALPEQGLIVTGHDTDVQTILECYSMDTGRKLSTLFLREKIALSGCCAGRDDQLWFYSQDTLYRWELSAAVDDESCYTAPLYTRDAPDKVGLLMLYPAIKELETRYGIDLVTGEEALGCIPWDYRFETEYIPQAYQKALTLLKEAMGQFPDNFFTLAADRTPGKKLTIVLTRNIFGSAEKGNLDSAGSSQYWLEGSPYIALSLSGDVVQNFFHAMGHVIDSRVLSTTAAFYEWHKVNPPGFQYDKDYTANLNRDEQQYLVGDDRWFIDTYSMSFEIEDRSRIFEYASQPGNEEFFVSAHMQTKLKRICNGIRQAFGLKNDSRQFIWEQYLKK